jgi:hypothetical protein
MLILGAEEESAPAGGRTAAAAPEATRRSKRGLYPAGLILLCAAALFLLLRHIEGTMPYPYHADEGFNSGPAYNILVKGQLQPHRFNYPSRPSYIAAASMAAGFVRGAAHLELREVSQIGRVTYPYYESPRVMKTARQAFALLAVVCLAATGLSVVDLIWARDRTGLDALLEDVPAPAVLMVPRRGADRRSPGQKAADALNAASRGRRVIKSFGTNDVLVNYSSTTAWATRPLRSPS